MQKHIIFIFGLLATMFIVSCNPQQATKVGEQNKFITATCDSLNDFANALPKLESNKEYQLLTVTCLATARSYFLEYGNKNDSLSKITIQLRDCDIKENEVFLTDIKQSYDNTTRSYAGFSVSKLIGQYASTYNDTVSQNESTFTISKFNSVLKNRYAFQISAKQKIEPNKQLQFDNFIKEFISKIDTTLLK